MFRALGLILLIWFLSSLFASSFNAADSAMTATFEAFEAAAKQTEMNIKYQQ